MFCSFLITLTIRQLIIEAEGQHSRIVIPFRAKTILFPFIYYQNIYVMKFVCFSSTFFLAEFVKKAHVNLNINLHQFFGMKLKRKERPN